MAIANLGRPTAVDPYLVAEAIFRVLGRGGAFLGSRQFPRHLILPRGLPGPAVG